MGQYTDAGELQAVQADLKDVPTPAIEAAISDAEAEINANLGVQYTLPLTIEVPVLRSLANDIALYKIFTGRPYQTRTQQTEIPWSTRYSNAVGLLLRIASGEVPLIGADGALIERAETAGAGTAWSNTMRYQPTFSEGRDQSFVVDPNKEPR